jgi:hypothetical protein
MRRAAGRVALALALALSAGRPAGAQPSTELAISSRSHIWLDGTTNVNSWRCSGDDVGGVAEVNASPEALVQRLAEWESRPDGTRLETPASSAGDLRAMLDLRIPIAALDCANGPMERDMRRALRADRFPEIHYTFRRLREARFTPAGSVPAFTLVVEGDLTLAGRTQPVAFTVTSTRHGDHFRLRGGLRVKMTDFDIEPPVAMLGIIRARDELWVSLDVELSVLSSDAP